MAPDAPAAETAPYDIGDAPAGAGGHFYADWCDEDETMACIKTRGSKKGICWTRHRVAAAVYEKYRQGGDTTKTVIVSTASPL